MTRAWWAGAAAALVAFVALVAGGLGYQLGAAQHDVAYHDGRAIVGEQVMTAWANGHAYGVEGSVPVWIDARDALHDGGWPDCLPRGSYDLRFGEKLIPLAGSGSYAVVAVDCRTVRRLPDDTPSDG